MLIEKFKVNIPMDHIILVYFKKSKKFLKKNYSLTHLYLINFFVKLIPKVNKLIIKKVKVIFFAIASIKYQTN